jgi:hypothetical protein
LDGTGNAMMVGAIVVKRQGDRIIDITFQSPEEQSQPQAQQAPAELFSPFHLLTQSKEEPSLVTALK